MSFETVSIDRRKSTERIQRDIETLGGSDFTRSANAIERYAYTPEYRHTLDYFAGEFEALGFEVSEDPVGNFFARNRPTGESAFGLGSHCDSNRNGGKYDGTMGVVVALEVCRLSTELGLDLPLQAISFLEEEGSGFGQGLLGSRVIMGRVSDEDIRENFRSLDDGRSFFEHATDAGYEPERWRECGSGLDGLIGWLELHIEQGRVLQDTSTQIGVVTAIVGVCWSEILFEGRADHAGATPMGFRADAAIPAAETILELERRASATTVPTVGTVGQCGFDPDLVNVIPGQVRLSVDVRSVDEDSYHGVTTAITAFAATSAERHGVTATSRQTLDSPPAPLDEAVIRAMTQAAEACGVSYREMPSGGGHDTQVIASRVPSAMVFVPCVDGISHAPNEVADPADGAAAAEVMLNAARSLAG